MCIGGAKRGRSQNEKGLLAPLDDQEKLLRIKSKKLEKALDQGAYAFGYSGDYWTLDRITQIIWQLFKVRYHPSGVWHILDRMGWSNQRPQRLPLHRNDETIAVWKIEVSPEVKKDS